jgi:hypothetical protein
MLPIDGGVVMATVQSLAESEVAAVRQALSANKSVTVWFTPTAVGVPVGGSAKVVSVGEVAEGEFIEVKPAGSRDTMFCSPNELTTARPPRRRAAREDARGARPDGGAEPAASEEPPLAPPAPTRAPVPASTPASTPAPVPRKGVQRRPQSAEVVITLVSSAQGDWTVEVTVGKKRVVRYLPVSPADVAKSARSLPAPVAEAIEASLAAARQRQAERVEQLTAELEAAQRALRELNG